MTNRSFPRLKKRLLVEFEDAAGTRHTAYTKDFSLTGLFVVSDARPAPGDPQTVKVHLPRAAVELAGQVIRQGSGAAGASGALSVRSDGFAFAFSAFNEAYSDYVARMERLGPEISREMSPVR
ncbi:MAG: PilZ domain-containing protein [Acidobacteria bacterium]|nr:MAG: PilZ domain-containing protein [Acidobacteriota bacterium]MCE7958277.1 PilZ domain-containing protein [Acidobacteria bacterium ACB2]